MGARRSRFCVALQGNSALAGEVLASWRAGYRENVQEVAGTAGGIENGWPGGEWNLVSIGVEGTLSEAASCPIG